MIRMQVIYLCTYQMQSPYIRLQIVTVKFDSQFKLFTQIDPFRSQVGHNINGEHRTNMLQVKLNLRRELEEISDEPEEMRRINFQLQISQNLIMKSLDQRIVSFQQEINCELL